MAVLVDLRSGQLICRPGWREECRGGLHLWLRWNRIIGPGNIDLPAPYWAGLFQEERSSSQEDERPEQVGLTARDGLDYGAEPAGVPGMRTVVALGKLGSWEVGLLGPAGGAFSQQGLYQTTSTSSRLYHPPFLLSIRSFPHLMTFIPANCCLAACPEPAPIAPMGMAGPLKGQRGSRTLWGSRHPVHGPSTIQ